MSSNIRVQRVCQFCKSTFEARTTVTKYCGDTCAKRAYKARKRTEKIQDSNKQTVTVLTKPYSLIAEKEFLTVNETAELIGASKRTVYRLIDANILESANLGIRLTRIKKDSVQKLFKD